jgi:predicted GNAT family acetyltransferase
MASRCEARIDGKLADVSEYELTPDTIAFLHTVVADEHKAMGRRGIARYAREDTRALGIAYLRSAR